MAGKVGFIGLGAMGGPMARNLISADTPLVVHDIDAAKTAELNAEVAGSAKEVASKVERTILIVETTDQAQSVIAGARHRPRAPSRATSWSACRPSILSRRARWPRTSRPRASP